MIEATTFDTDSTEEHGRARTRHAGCQRHAGERRLPSVGQPMMCSTKENKSGQDMGSAGPMPAFGRHGLVARITAASTDGLRSGVRRDDPCDPPALKARGPASTF